MLLRSLWVRMHVSVCCVVHAPLPPALLTAGTELMFICCGWFIGEAARAPIGAWDIWALGRAMWLNWLIPVQKSGPQCSAMDTHNWTRSADTQHNVTIVVKIYTFFRPLSMCSASETFFPFVFYNFLYFFSCFSYVLLVFQCLFCLVMWLLQIRFSA